MTKTANLVGIRVFWLLMLIALWSSGIKAQTANNPVLKWDKEVGCIKYDDRGEKDHYNLYEQIQAGFCLRVCEGSKVNYTFSADHLVQVEWDINGGYLQNSSTTDATVVWGNAGNGSLTLTITYDDNTVEVLTVCVEKIHSPKAYFENDGIDPQQREFCTFLPISFNNLSDNNGGSDIVNYLWDFGDNTTSSTFEPTHTYNQPGAYRITLTVTNSCNCSATYEWEIKVMDAKEFEISCPSVVCEGSRETYSVSDGCGGEWEVKGGTIIANNGTSIEVVWDHVDPEDGFGYISYRSKCSCPIWTTVKVPVILRDAKIQGPRVVCEGGQGRFTLPQWPATEFEWMINGQPYHPMLVHTDQRNEIVVDGLAPGSYSLGVRYRNTLIDDGNCSGRAEIEFRVEERPQIQMKGELTACQNTPMSFYTHNGTTVQWQILLNGNVIYDQTGNQIDYDFPNAGTHVITASNNGCKADPVTVEIIKTPALTGAIDGPHKVCLNTPYTYTINEQEAGFIYVWSVVNGQVIGNNTGSQADVSFTSTPAIVRVIKQAVKNGTTCDSTPVEFMVEQIVVNPSIINNSGLVEFCPSSSATFTLNLGDITPDYIEWSIESSTGAKNFGSVINGINSATATVSFNEISTSANGFVKVAVTKCGKIVTAVYPIKLVENPVLTIGAIAAICPSETTITIPLSITPALATSAQIQVFIDGVSQGNFTYTGGSSLVIPNGFTNNSNNNIARTLSLKLDVCNYSTTTTTNVTVFPKTELYISPNYSYVVCPTTYNAINLTSTVSTGITSSVVFKWYKVGNPNPIPGFNGPSLSISGPNPGGTYYLEVLDQNTCLVKSDPIYVIEDCSGNPGTGPGCTISPDPNATVFANWTDCNTITTGINANYPPTSITWSGSTHLTLVPGTEHAPVGQFTTTTPGIHTITGYLTYGTCTLIKTYTVKKHYEPKLATAITCNGDGTYKVVLHNNTLTFGIATSSLNFTYAGPGIPFGASGNSYTLNSVSPGTHTYTLTVSAPGFPSCTVSLPVTLDVEPSPNFSLSPLTYCAEDKIMLTIPNYNANNSYTWIFNGTSFVASGVTTEIQISTIGSIPIKLRITTPYGCTYETMGSNVPSVDIRKANFTGITIHQPTADYCVGSALPLTVSSVPMPSNVIWMQGNNQIATGTSFLPTQSGSYWPILIDQNGCATSVMAANPKTYILRQPPFASISGNTSLCYGENTVLTGITTDPTVSHAWSGPSLPSGYGNWVIGNTNKVLSIAGLSPGTYNYTFMTRAANDASCINSFTTTVVVHPQVQTPTISYSLINCDPYTLKLTANGPTTGVYNWSNGMSGQTIEVTHGGAYSVTYTETTGCSATGDVQTPHNPQRALWVVPSGCYTVCNPAYLIGPLGTYSGYEWQVNSIAVQAGSPYTPPQSIISGGAYQLIVEQDGCKFGSNTPDIQFDFRRCPPTPCKFRVGFELMEIIPGGFIYYMFIDNPTGSPMSIQLSSLNGYGTFTPDVFVLSPGYNAFPVEFHVNGTYFPGANDVFVINSPNCSDTVKITLPETHWRARTTQAAASLILSPNPTVDQTTVTFNVGTEYEQAQNITVYNMMGVRLHHQKIEGKAGEVSLNVRHFTRGTYLITLEADGKRIATEKLIKK